MSNSRGKETYVVIFLRSLAECSNRWGWPEREDERGERGEGAEKWQQRESRGRGEDTYFEIKSVIHHYNIQNTTQLVKSENTCFPSRMSHIYTFITT